MNDASIDRLVSDHLDGALDAAGRERLEAWLAADATHRRRFVRLAMDHAALLRLTSVMAAKPATVRTRRILERRPRAWRLPLALAASLLLAVGGWWLWAGAGAAERQPLLLADGSRLAAGSTVAAPADAAAVLRWDDGSEIRLLPGTQAEVGSGLDLRLLRGRLEAAIATQPEHQPARFATAEAVVTVVGTTLAVEAGEGESAAEVEHGRIGVRRTADGAEVAVSAGECVAIVPGRDLRVRPLGTPSGTVHRVAPGGAWPDLGRLQPGDAIELAAGTHVGAWRLRASGTALRPIVVRGAGMDATLIDATGAQTSGERSAPRAALQVDGHHVIVADLALRGARNTTANAAGLRLLPTADAVTLRASRISGCDLGISADPGSGALLVEDCVIHGNGIASAVRSTHNLRLANRSATVRGCRISDAPFGANIELHDGRHRLIGNRISGGAEGEIGIGLTQTTSCELEAVGNLVVGRARATDSNHDRFIYVNRPGGATGTVQLRLHACTLVAGAPLNWMIDAAGGEVTLTASIVAGSTRLATPGTRLGGHGNCLPEHADAGALSGTLHGDPGFADPAAGDYRLAPTSPCRGVAVPQPPAIAPPGTDAPAGPRPAAGGIGAY